MEKLKPYFFISPAIIWVAAIFIFPVLNVIYSSFRITGSNSQTYFGIHNFELLFKDRIFWYSIKNNSMFLLAIPILVMLSLIIAVVLFERLKGWRIVQSVILIPYVLAIPITGVMFKYILQYNGVLNFILKNVGLSFLIRDWLVDETTTIPIIMAVMIWREVGFGTVIFLARLMSIDEDIIEAAMIDGAGWWQRLFKILIPQMRKVIEFYTVILALTIFGWLFDYIYVMTSRGGLGFKASTMDFYVYSYMFIFKHFNIAYAAALVLLLISTILIIIRWRLTKNTLEI